ncbi:MAG: hypothetical protein HN590_15675 [Calditrichaeota bacterium]|nr:hypothetical protein [Deltaproteobacteria bacterium]MBT4641581.1 hypothetical protein [Deltaproteobacteria bacterium]MBT7618715.1 hypothetical protein [Calditrichota bacterium]
MVTPKADCDLWWNEVEQHENRLYIASHEVLDKDHRIADIVACGEHLDLTIKKAYENIQKIKCLGSYYRTDVGDTLWPPGNGF